MSSIIGIKITADPSGLKKGLEDAANDVVQFGTKAAQALSGLKGEAANTQGMVGNLANGLKNAFVGATIGAAVVGITSSLRDFKAELIAVQIQADKTRNGLNFAVGAGNSVREMEFMRTSALTLGLELTSTTEQYTKLAAAARGTALQGQGARDIFTSLAQASTVMGLSANQTEGALLAVTQMISKGKVQSEELRGQLGERLPGAFQIAARAMGVTTGELDKMLESGQVLAEDFLPKFAAQLSREVAPQVEEASKSMQASVNRLANASTELKRAINEAGAGDFLRSLTDSSATFLNSITDSMRQVRESGSGTFTQLASGLGTVLVRALQLQRIDVSLQTHPERIDALNEKLAESEKMLLQFQGKAATDPTNMFLARGIEQLQETIKYLRIARGEQLALVADQSGNNAEDARLNRNAVQYATDKTASARLTADLAGVRAKLSPGMDADYQKNLNILQAARAAGEDKGGVSEKTYIDLVSELAKKNYTAPKAEKKDHNLESMQGQIKAARERIAVADEQAESMDKLTESEKRYQALQADSTKGFSKAALAARTEALAQLELAGAKERLNAQRATDAAALQSYSRASDDQLAKLKEEAATYNLTGVALQKITAARALDKAAENAIFETKIDANGLEQTRVKVTGELAAKILTRADADKKATAALIEQVAAQKQIIQNDEELARLKANSTVYLDASTKALALLDLERAKRRKNLEAFKEDSEERRRLIEQDAELYQAGLDNIKADKLREVWQSVDQTAHQTFVNIFEGGQDAFTKLRDTLKSTLLDLLYQMTVRKWIFDITAAVTGSGGITNNAQQAIMGGGGGAGGVIGDLANGKSIYDMVTGGMAGVGSTISTVGNLVGSSSLSAYGAGMGLSTEAAAAAAAAYTEAAATVATSNAALAATYTEVAGSITAGASTTATAGGIGTGISSALSAIPVWGWIALALSTQLGGPQIDHVGDGLSGTLSATGSSIQKRTDYKEDHHGLFGIGAFTTHNSEYSDADTGTSNYISSMVTSMTAATKGYAVSIGLSADAVAGFTKQIDLSLTGLNPAEQKGVIDKAISGFVDDMVASAYGGALSGVAKAGESSSATLQRLAVDFTQVNAALDLLGISLLPVGIESAKASAGLVDAFGGLDAMNQSVAAYYKIMYSDGERAALATEMMGEQFKKLGLAVPTSEAEFKALVASIDITTESGQNLAASVLNLAPAFDAAAQAAQTAANNMLSALQNYGTSAEVRDFQVNQIGTALRNAGITVDNNTIANGTREQYRAAYEMFVAQGNTRAADALMAQQQNFANITKATNTPQTTIGSSGGGGGGGQAAANAIDKAWQQITDSIFGEVQRIRGLLDQPGKEALAAAQARFELGNVMALAGDQNAAKALPELSKNLLSVAEANARTLEDLNGIRAQVADRLASTGGTLSALYGTSIPAFAGGGVHTGGWAMVGEQGPELAYMPPARIYTNSDTRAMLGGGNDALAQQVAYLNAQVAALVAAAGREVVAAEKTASVLETVTRKGRAMQTEAYT